MFSAWYPTTNDMLLGNFVQNHALAIAEHATVILIHPFEYGHRYNILYSDIQNLHEIRIAFPCCKRHFFGKILRTIRMYKAYYMGIQYAMQHFGKPDICHANILTRACLPAYYLKVRYHIPYIITEHWSRYLTGKKGFSNPVHIWLTKYLVSRARCVTTVSRHLAQAMQQHGLHQKYVIIPNVVDENIFTLPPQNGSANSHTILHISGLDKETKNWKEILEATAILASKRQDFTLLMLGDGPDKAQAVAMAEQMRLSPAIVQFHSNVPNNEIPAFIHQSCCMLLYSTTETQGLVLIESMFCGKPVIASDISAIQETIGDNSGILVPLHQPALLAQAMNNMLENAGDYAPEDLRNFAIKRYGKQAVGTAFLQLYRQYIHQQTNRNQKYLTI